jgi:hypothetical protein
MTKIYEPQERWDNFWKEILILPDGSIDVEQLKKELCDFSVLINNIPKIFDAITGGMVSKPMTDPDVVISLHDDYVDRMVEQAVEDYKEENNA